MGRSHRQKKKNLRGHFKLLLVAALIIIAILPLIYVESLERPRYEFLEGNDPVAIDAGSNFQTLDFQFSAKPGAYKTATAELLSKGWQPTTNPRGATYGSFERREYPFTSDPSAIEPAYGDIFLSLQEVKETTHYETSNSKQLDNAVTFRVRIVHKLHPLARTWNALQSRFRS